MKRKVALNYRRGGTAFQCEGCDEYVGCYEVRGIGGEAVRFEPRCRVMGLEDGRGYRINPRNICDRFTNREKLRRLGVGVDA